MRQRQLWIAILLQAVPAIGITTWGIASWIDTYPGKSLADVNLPPLGNLHWWDLALLGLLVCGTGYFYTGHKMRFLLFGPAALVISLGSFALVMGLAQIPTSDAFAPTTSPSAGFISATQQNVASTHQAQIIAVLIVDFVTVALIADLIQSIVRNQKIAQPDTQLTILREMPVRHHWAMGGIGVVVLIGAIAVGPGHVFVSNRCPSSSSDSTTVSGVAQGDVQNDLQSYAILRDDAGGTCYLVWDRNNAPQIPDPPARVTFTNVRAFNVSLQD